MELVGGMASTFPRRAHNVKASSQCFGMFHVLTYMQFKHIGAVVDRLTDCDFRADAKSNLTVQRY